MLTTLFLIHYVNFE